VESRCERALREGAQSSPIPTVPCAHATTGQPPFGGVPFGKNSAPDTGTVPCPFTPSVEE